MPSRATIRECAKLAGVSVATVSRTLRGQPGVSDETRRWVRECAQKVGYLPNGAARGLVEGRLGAVGVIFPDLGDPESEPGDEILVYSDEVIRGVERAARAKDCAVVIAATYQGSGRDLAFAVAGKVDGLVVMARALERADIETLAHIMPVIVVAGRRRRVATDYVTVDNEGGMRMLTRHLIEVHGYRDLLFIAGPKGSPDGQARFAGYKAALAEAGWEAPSHPAAWGAFTEASGARAMEDILSARRAPEAVVAANDQMAVGAMGVLWKHGYRVSEQVAVTGFDDIQLSKHSTPPLTTVHQPMREIGMTCMQLIVQRLAGEGPQDRATVLPVELVVRGSCGCDWRQASEGLSQVGE